jgi:hypothetical protein
MVFRFREILLGLTFKLTTRLFGEDCITKINANSIMDPCVDHFSRIGNTKIKIKRKREKIPLPNFAV